MKRQGGDYFHRDPLRVTIEWVTREGKPVFYDRSFKTPEEKTRAFEQAIKNIMNVGGGIKVVGGFPPGTAGVSPPTEEANAGVPSPTAFAPRPPLQGGADTHEGDGEKTHRPWITQAVAVAMLLVALNPDNPYGYYTLLRFVCCGIFAYLWMLEWAGKERGWVLWGFGGLAVLYNPLIRVSLEREVWEVMNVLTVVFVIVASGLPRAVGRKFWAWFTSNPAHYFCAGLAGAVLLFLILRAAVDNHTPRKTEPMKWWEDPAHLYPHMETETERRVREILEKTPDKPDTSLRQ